MTIRDGLCGLRRRRPAAATEGRAATDGRAAIWELATVLENIVKDDLVSDHGLEPTT